MTHLSSPIDWEKTFSAVTRVISQKNKKSLNLRTISSDEFGSIRYRETIHEPVNDSLMHL